MPKIVVKTDVLEHTAAQIDRVGQAIAVERGKLRLITLSGIARKSGVSSEIHSCLRDLEKLSIKCERLAKSTKRAAGILSNCERRQVVKITGTLKSFVSFFDFIFKPAEPDWNRPIETRQDYYDYVDDRARYAIDPDAKALYFKYKDDIRMGSDTVEDGAYYQPFWNKVYINWEGDAVNDSGPGSIYFHEVGHMIDDYTAFFGHSSSGKRFTVSLQTDFDNYVSSIMAQEGLTRKQAYQHISEWLWVDPDTKVGVSDLMGGLSNNECAGKWLHDKDYWRGSQHGVPDNVNNEAFAHFFEASMSTDSAKLDYLREVFPTAYEEYRKIVRENL